MALVTGGNRGYRERWAWLRHLQGWKGFRHIQRLRGKERWRVDRTYSLPRTLRARDPRATSSTRHRATDQGRNLMRPDELERRLQRLDAVGPAPPRRTAPPVLMLPDSDRVGAIGSYWGNPRPAPSPSSDRLRGGPDALGGARRDAAGVLTARACPSSGTKYVTCRVTS